MCGTPPAAWINPWDIEGAMEKEVGGGCFPTRLTGAGRLRTGLPPPQAWMKKSLGFPPKLGQPVPLKMFTILSTDTGYPSMP